jgi:hypothetical protein
MLAEGVSTAASSQHVPERPNGVVYVRGDAEMRERAASAGNVENDPERTIGSQICCDAQRTP